MFSYDPSTDRGRVRLLVRDHIDASHIFEDEDIDAFLSLTAEGSGRLAVYEAAILAANTIANHRAAGAGRITIGGVTFEKAEAARLYRGAVDIWERRLANEIDTGAVDWTDEDVRYAKVQFGHLESEYETERH